MPRQMLPLAAIRAFLIDRTTDMLRRDARFIAAKLEFRQRDGEPNWDANIGIADPVVIRAFGAALNELQREYDCRMVKWRVDVD
jgi:hypothetical protein